MTVTMTMEEYINLTRKAEERDIIVNCTRDVNNRMRSIPVTKELSELVNCIANEYIDELQYRFAKN